MKVHFHHSLRAATLIGACAVLLASPAQAQSSGTASEKPSVKQASSTSKAAPKSSATSAGERAKESKTSGGERLMTRDELRVCLSRSDELVARRQQIEREDAALLAERKVLDALADELRRNHEVIRAESEQKQAAFKARADQLTARVTAFRDKTAEDKSGRGRVQSRSELEALERERVQLDTDIKALNADRDVLIKELEARTDGHNVKVTERDQKIAVFTERHRVYKSFVEKHEAEGETWRRECGDRPYREDDEKAIRAGK